MTKRLAWILCLMAVGMSAGCGRQTDPVAPPPMSGARPLRLVAVNYPLSYFATRIGGEDVEVIFPEMDGDPAYWVPTAEDVAIFQAADLILLNGADYAKWLHKVSLPAAGMVHTGDALTGDLLELGDQVTHTHGPGGAHEHVGFAFTTWLNPQFAVPQARAIKDALVIKRSDLGPGFVERFAALETDLMELDRRLEAITASHPDRPVVFSHPVYQYLQKRYGLNGVSVHWEPDAIPTAEQLAALKAELEKHPAKWMIWEGVPSAASVQQIEELGLGSVVFDPCGNTPASGDYLSQMQNNLEQLARVYAD